MIKSIIIAIFITLGMAICCSCGSISKKAKTQGTFWSVEEEHHVPGTLKWN